MYSGEDLLVGLLRVTTPILCKSELFVGETFVIYKGSWYYGSFNHNFLLLSSNSSVIISNVFEK